MVTTAMTEEDRGAITSFAEIARRYCTWAESEQGDPHHEMEFVHAILAELNLSLLRLPNLGLPEREDANADIPNKWEFVQNRFFNLPVQGYWDVFDPLKEESPVFNTLPDDLADIYANLKDGLYLFDEGDFAGAVWEWRFQYIIHWGAHLTGAQRAIYAYFSQHDELFV